MLGRRVRIPDHPARIVSLAPSITETVFALGDGDRLVGVTDYCDYPPEATRKPRVGGISTPNFEAILGAPARPGHRHLGEQLRGARRAARRRSGCRLRGAARRLGRPFSSRSSASATIAGPRRRARARGGRDAARRGRHRARGRAARHARASSTWCGRTRSSRQVVARSSTELIRRAGGESVTSAEPLPVPAPVAGDGGRAAPRPHHRGPPRAGDRRGAAPRLGAASARSPPCAEGRVYGVDGDLVHRPGPRMVEALRALARVIHPERVP